MPRPAALPEIALPAEPTEQSTATFLDEARAALRDRGTALIRRTGPRTGVPQAMLDALSSMSGASTARLADLLAAAAPPAPSHDQPSPGIPALPLHRDGALIGRPPSFIAFTATSVEPGTHDSALELVDTVAALPALSHDLRDLLDTHPLEYRVLDRRPFPHLPEGWFELPAYTSTPTGQALNIILPPAAPGPWQTRLRGLTDGDSAEALRRIDDELRRSPAYITHSWSAGDIILVDNSRVLHGLRATPAGSRARLARASS
ncbi:TauD/TfdA family dioxygenase [Hoyosella sp. G463]|uniref:TauD/TfdA family dioxygenase n=1 Tax=Lolliginicoccus lacisalsi TaxID=2742202 RepID=A0A927PL62_9ACTN|nr:TauD/TfdA family dioxygenase [Lolliginicoccus lacisalsi]MBD8505101.1 TauD/TfdA family dioxygenase [Lolliginicoccus lacisalsi]